MPQVTSLYAVLGVLLVLVLGAAVVRQRRRAHIGIGDGGDADLARAIRAHANLIENLPLALVMLLLLELGGLAQLWLHLLGGGFLASRLLHAWGLSRRSGVSFGRFWGMTGTWLAMLVKALLLLWMLVDRLSA